MGKHRNKQPKGEGRFSDYPRKGFKQSFAAFCRATCPGWGDFARGLVEDFAADRVWEPGPALDDPILKDVRLFMPDLGQYRVKRLANRKKMGPVWLPDLMDLWERKPKVVRISQEAVGMLRNVDTALFDEQQAREVFPCALFIDLHEASRSFEDLPEGVFVWPTANWATRPRLRAVTFPDAATCTVSALVDVTNDGIDSEYARKERMRVMRARTEGESAPKGVSALVPSARRSYSLAVRSAGKSYDEVWKMIESTNDQLPEEPDDDECLGLPSTFSDVSPLEEVPVYWAAADVDLEALRESVFALLACAFGAVPGLDRRLVREGDLDVLVVRTSAEAKAIRRQDQLAAKAERADEVRAEAVRKLMLAREEIARLRGQVASLCADGTGSSAPADDNREGETVDGEAEALEADARAAYEELDRVRTAWEGRIAELEKQVGIERQKAQDAERRASLAEDKASALESRAQIIDEVQLPLTCESAARLAQRAWSDKLLLLPSAFKSAAAFNPKRADEVFDVLRACALHLHRLAFSDEAVDVTRAFQAASGYEVAMRDVKLVRQSARLKKARTFVYRSHKVEMIPHVKGSSNKPGEALRVHFHLDHERQLVVIGHCGEHLTGEIPPK